MTHQSYYQNSSKQQNFFEQQLDSVFVRSFCRAHRIFSREPVFARVFQVCRPCMNSHASCVTEADVLSISSVISLWMSGCE
ncbi:hypothetical protein BsWGS_14055 [Bradybaena similaris]